MAVRRAVASAVATAIASAVATDIATAVRSPADGDMATLLQRQQQIEPEAKQVQAWQASYLSHLVRQESYALDAREVREYFHFERVQAGIFELTEDLFGVGIIPWQTQTWHEDVTAWEIREGNQVIGPLLAFIQRNIE